MKTRLVKVVDFNKTMHLKVTGIAEDAPVNSHLDFHMLVPLSNSKNQPWMNQSPKTVLFSICAIEPDNRS